MWKNFRNKYITLPLLSTAIFFVKQIINLLLFTCEVKVKGLDHFTKIASEQNCILMLWHNRLLIVASILYKHASQFNYRAVVSKSRDAEVLAQLIESYPMGHTLRVPHNARYQALTEMITKLKEGGEVLVITPDGPRGPRYKVKPGITIAAKKANACVIPLSWTADSYWELNSWDKFRIPKPFSKITFIFGEFITLKQEESHQVEQELLEKVLLNLCQEDEKNGSQ